MYSKLQYISQGNTSEEQVEAIRSALDAGCTWIQLRFKQQPMEVVEQLASKIKPLCDSHNAVLIINDHYKVAKHVDAHGVHLGLGDGPVIEARMALGPNKIIGGTANTLQDVINRSKEKCDYVGLGPFKFTITKEKLSPILGQEGYRKIIMELEKLNISIPVFAIGGIQLGDVDTVMDTGVHGIAVSGLITHYRKKKELVEQINSRLYAKAQDSK